MLAAIGIDDHHHRWAWCDAPAIKGYIRSDRHAKHLPPRRQRRTGVQCILPRMDRRSRRASHGSSWSDSLLWISSAWQLTGWMKSCYSLAIKCAWELGSGPKIMSQKVAYFYEFETALRAAYFIRIKACSPSRTSLDGHYNMWCFSADGRLSSDERSNLIWLASEMAFLSGDFISRKSPATPIFADNAYLYWPSEINIDYWLLKGYEHFHMLKKRA